MLTLAWINAKAGARVQGHGLRATFVSIAEELVSGGVPKRMINHADGGDVTLGHYVGKSEAQLRAGWQAVADFIESAAVAAGQLMATREEINVPPKPTFRRRVQPVRVLVQPSRSLRTPRAATAGAVSHRKS